MKKFITTLTSFFIVAIVMAQVPDVMNYQAVARNNAGVALANQTIKVRLTITKNAVSLYSETRQVTTNALGLFNLQIGSAGAISTTGNFSTINWQNNPTTHYLKVELDVNNGTTFTDMGSQALVSVPYSFNSKTADKATEVTNIAGRPIDQTAAPTVGARLSWNGTNWAPVKKDTVYNVIQIGSPLGAINSAPNWIFLSPSITPITLNGGERVNVNLAGAVFYAGTAINSFLVAVCYQLADLSGPVTAFTVNPTYMSAIPGNGSSRSTQISASGAINLPAGNYIIGLAIKANVHPLTGTDHTNGTIDIRY